MGSNTTPGTPQGLSTLPSEAAVGFEAGKLVGTRIGEPRVASVLAHPVPYTVLPDGMGGYKVEWLTANYSNPDGRKGLVHLHDADSFVAYVLTHARPESAIYATLSPAKFLAVLDEHPGYVTPPASLPAAPATEPPAPPKGGKLAVVVDAPPAFKQPPASWREFRADFEPKFSDEWATWTNHNGKGSAFSSTESFALFLEDNLPDIVDPPGAELLAIALDFRVQQNVAYRAANRLSDGNVNIVYSNVVEGESRMEGSAREIRVPEKFTIEVPVFAGLNQEKYRVDARFRFRLHNGQLTIWYELIRPKKVLEAAFTALHQRIAEKTNRPILLGTPE